VRELGGLGTAVTQILPPFSMYLTFASHRFTSLHVLYASTTKGQFTPAPLPPHRDVRDSLNLSNYTQTRSGFVFRAHSEVWRLRITMIIIIIIIIISFMQGIRTYIPQTNYVSRVYSVAAILRVLLMVHIALSSI
jgi:hypothetical protein